MRRSRITDQTDTAPAIGRTETQLTLDAVGADGLEYLESGGNGRRHRRHRERCAGSRSEASGGDRR